MQKFILFYLLLVTSTKLKAQSHTEFSIKNAKTITAKNLKQHVYTLASDKFEGRKTGEIGFRKAAEYIQNFYSINTIKSPLGKGDYFQDIPSEFLSNNSRKRPLKDSKNILAFIKGSEKPDEVIVISAHLDHGGTKFDKIFNGADDNASGTAAVLEIAKAFKKASDEGNPPKRTLLFLHTTAEEFGKMGSKYYTEHPVFPLANTVANINIDMIGRIDKKHNNNSNYIYSIGADAMSTDLKNISETINKKYININLDYRYNSLNHPEHFFYRSDHYNFAKHNIPVLFFFNGTHEDYHKHTDTAEKIDYNLLTKRTQLIFHTIWEITNRDKRVAKKWIAPFHKLVTASTKKRYAFVGIIIFLIILIAFFYFKRKRKHKQKHIS